jgi:hypothetical protein
MVQLTSCYLPRSIALLTFGYWCTYMGVELVENTWYCQRLNCISSRICDHSDLSFRNIIQQYRSAISFSNIVQQYHLVISVSGTLSGAKSHDNWVVTWGRNFKYLGNVRWNVLTAQRRLQHITLSSTRGAFFRSFLHHTKPCRSGLTEFCPQSNTTINDKTTSTAQYLKPLKHKPDWPQPVSRTIGCLLYFCFTFHL